VLAFEDAEGFGAATLGGRGGQIVKVTNLDDSGVGSLRWALESVAGPRIVVFDVAGSIHLDSQILVRDGNVTLAGQTAPGDGITIEGSRIRLKASEIVVQGLKFRPGDAADGQAPADRDGLFVGTTDFTITNIVIDHNSFSWAVDENLTLNGRLRNITVSNNVIAEGLSNSINPAGEHSKGMLVSNWSSTDPAANSFITITKNLFAHNMDRNPEVRAGQNIEIVNNYIYDPGRAERAIAVGGGNGGTLTTTAHVIGNVFDAGSDSSCAVPVIALSAMAAGSGVHVDGNIAVDAASGSNLGSTWLIGDNGGGGFAFGDPIFLPSGVDMLDAAGLAAHLLANAGAAPQARDVIDARIFAELFAGTGGIIDKPAERGGLPATGSVTAAADSDNDGMPDWYEDREGLAWDSAGANRDNDGDGFTDIEEYLHDLIAGMDDAAGKPTLASNGTAGADYFIFDPSFALFAREIRDFNPFGGDRIVLDGAIATGASPVLTDFIEVIETGRSTVIAIDRDGTGTQFGKTFLAEVLGLRDAQAIRDSIFILPREAGDPIAVDGRDLAVAVSATGNSAAIWQQSAIDNSAADQPGGGPDFSAYLF
jgi:pectate lyase